MPVIKKIYVPDAFARWWRLPAVMAYTQRSRSAIYGDPTFPKSIKLAPNTAAWLVIDVMNWCEAQEHRSAKRLTPANANKMDTQ